MWWLKSDICLKDDRNYKGYIKLNPCLFPVSIWGALFTASFSLANKNLAQKKEEKKREPTNILNYPQLNMTSYIIFKRVIVKEFTVVFF